MCVWIMLLGCHKFVPAFEIESFAVRPWRLLYFCSTTRVSLHRFCSALPSFYYYYYYYYNNKCRNKVLCNIMRSQACLSTSTLYFQIKEGFFFAANASNSLWLDFLKSSFAWCSGTLCDLPSIVFHVSTTTSNTLLLYFLRKAWTKNFFNHFLVSISVIVFASSHGMVVAVLLRHIPDYLTEMAGLWHRRKKEKKT